MPDEITTIHQDINKLGQKMSTLPNISNKYLTGNMISSIGNPDDLINDTTNIKSSIKKFMKIAKQYFNSECMLSIPEDMLKQWRAYYRSNASGLLPVETNLEKIENLDYIYPVRYLTGYYVSRPNLKLVDQEAATLLDNTRKIYAKYLLTNFNNNEIWTSANKKLMGLEKALAFLQSQHVVNGLISNQIASDLISKINEASQENVEVNFYYVC